MSPFVSEEVDSLISDPERGKSVELVVTIQDGTRERLEEWLRDNSGEFLREAGFDLLLVEVPETKAEDLVELAYVNSVETNDSLEILQSGNSHSRRV